MLVGFVLQYVGPGEVAKCCCEGCTEDVCLGFLCWDHMSGQSGEVHCLVTSFLYHKCMRCVFMLDMHCVSRLRAQGQVPGSASSPGLPHL